MGVGFETGLVVTRDDLCQTCQVGLNQRTQGPGPAWDRRVSSRTVRRQHCKERGRAHCGARLAWKKRPCDESLGDWLLDQNGGTSINSMDSVGIPWERRGCCRRLKLGCLGADRNGRFADPLMSLPVTQAVRCGSADPVEWPSCAAAVSWFGGRNAAGQMRGGAA
jgi:hypothetical protein